MIFNYNAYGGGSNLSIAGGQSTTNRCYLFTRVIAGADHLAGGIGGNNFTVIYDPNPLVIGQSYHIKIEWTATTVNLYKNGNVVYTGNISGGVDTNNTLDVFQASGVGNNIKNSACCLIMKNGAGTTLSNMPLCGSSADIQTNKIHTISGTIDFTAKSDTASFYCDEYGFAVKSGAICPKLLDGSGYAGLVGDPDAVYQGLIALKGGYDEEAQNYLKALFDFEAVDNTEIENAGLILDDYTALDCNGDLIYTADPYLEPLTYPNAFTAMTLANVSRYNNLADNNASRRIFIKYKKGTDVTDDGSRALITAGTVQEILVYKRDLTVAEAVKVLKYCNDFPMDNQVMVGNVPSVDGDDNFVFSCTGHTEPEIEIEEP